MQIIEFVGSRTLPDRGPPSVPAWVWEEFRKSVSYREFRIRQWQEARDGPRRGFLQHEIKRAEITLGQWIGRIKEIEANG